MNKIIFVIEKCKLETDDANDWSELLSEKGIKLCEIQRVPCANTFEESFPSDLPKECYDSTLTIFYICTIEMCKILLMNQYRGINLKNLYYQAENELLCTNYYNKIKDNLLLNIGGDFTTLKELEEKWDKFFNIFGEKVFIRPNGGDKTFVGGCYYRDDYDMFFNKVKEYRQKCNYIQKFDNEICLISHSEDIVAEYRFSIYNRQVLCGCQYRRDNILDKRIDIMPGAFNCAELMAKNEWQPTGLYTCDVAELTNKKFKIIELNSGSCSGFYMLDKRKIVDGLIGLR